MRKPRWLYFSHLKKPYESDKNKFLSLYLQWFGSGKHILRHCGWVFIGPIVGPWSNRALLSAPPFIVRDGRCNGKKLNNYRNY